MTIEPKPKKVSIFDAGPLFLRVGVVLPEDQKDVLFFEPKFSESYFVHLKNKAPIKFRSKFIKASVLDNEVKLQFKEDSATIKNSIVKLYRKGVRKLSPQTGWLLKNIKIGRGFHWEQLVDLIYPYSLEIKAVSGALQVVNIVPFEEYLSCVVSSEMGELAPEEFIKAQIIAARNWCRIFLRDKHPGQDFDLCNDDDCQRYQGTTFLKEKFINSALKVTGEYLAAKDGFLLPTYYSKVCGGYTELPIYSFNFPVDGLSSIKDVPANKEVLTASNDTYYQADSSHCFYCSPAAVNYQEINRYLGAVDTPDNYFRWTYTVSSKDLAKNLTEKGFLPSCDEIISIIPLKRGISGRISQLKINYLVKGKEKALLMESQYKIRAALHKKFLYSSAFVIEKEGNTFNFFGAGWGHGVGLCQVGAVGMALKGFNYKDILSHYFPEAKIVKAEE